MTGSWQDRADELAAESLAAGEPYGWFDTLFAEGVAGETTMPWDRFDPHPLLASWGPVRTFAGGRAVVPGCGLGADAAFLAGLGVETLGFDVSPTAVRLARQRFGDPVPRSRPARFEQADLFDLPAGWAGAFDLVVEIYTVQAMPRTVRAAAIEAVTGLVAPGGVLLAVQGQLAEGRDPEEGPPWKLTGAEFASFASAGLEEISVELVDGFWRGTFRRPPADADEHVPAADVASADEIVGAVQQDGDRG